MEDPCEKDQFCGCDCQRYLAVGLLMPVLVLLSVFGGAAMLIVLPGRYFFCMRKSILQYFTEISTVKNFSGKSRNTIYFCVNIKSLYSRKDTFVSFSFQESRVRFLQIFCQSRFGFGCFEPAW